MEELEGEVVQFDPDISLRGGPDGPEGLSSHFVGGRQTPKIWRISMG